MSDWRRSFPIILATSLFWLSLFGLYLLSAKRHPAAQPIQILPPATLPVLSTPQASPTPAPLRVYVSGAVHAAGVYRLPADSLVDDALRAAGGATDTADLIAINLAHPLSDGEQIYVPVQGEEETSRNLSSMTSSSSGTAIPPAPPALDPSHPIDLNTATAAELETLPGIGPKTAATIISQRPYSRVEDLLRVRGIGDKTLAKLQSYIKVE